MATNITAEHPKYTEKKDQWKACSDAFDGNRKIKAEGETYLLKLTKDQENAEYLSYKGRAIFFEATGRTVNGLQGAALYKEPTIDLPTRLDGFIKLNDIRQFIRGLLLYGRYGVLVDLNADGSKAKFAAYDAANIITWKADDEGKFSRVVLKETYEDQGKEGEAIEATQYRELALVGGLYVQNVWRMNEKGDWVILETILPQKAGASLDFIPFILCNPEAITTEIMPPPMGGIVDLNLWHYRIHADYSHGLHFTALPTLACTGVPSDQQDKIKIGSGTAICIAAPDAKINYLEFTGQGLDAVEKALDKAEQQMAALGARLLSAPKKTVESAEAKRLDQGAENASLNTIVGTAETVLRAAVKIAADWLGLGEVKEDAITLYRDFVSERLSAQDVTALVGALQAGGMSKETFVNELRKGEIGSNTAEEELALIEKETPKLQGQPVNLDDKGQAAA